MEDVFNFEKARVSNVQWFLDVDVPENLAPTQVQQPVRIILAHENAFLALMQSLSITALSGLLRQKGWKRRPRDERGHEISR